MMQSAPRGSSVSAAGCRFLTLELATIERAEKSDIS